MDRATKYTDLQNPNSNQPPARLRLHEQMSSVKGAVSWYAKVVMDNVGDYGTVLRSYYRKYPALQPEMPFIDSKRPKKLRKLKPVWISDGYILSWTEPRDKDRGDVATEYAAYRFNKGERVNLDGPFEIVVTTTEAIYKLPYVGGRIKYRYVVIAPDRMGNEGKAKEKSVKL